MIEQQCDGSGFFPGVNMPPELVTAPGPCPGCVACTITVEANHVPIAVVVKTWTKSGKPKPDVRFVPEQNA